MAEAAGDGFDDIERLDDILDEESYPDMDHGASPKALSEPGSIPRAAEPMDTDEGSRQKSVSVTARPERQRIPIGPVKDSASAPKRQNSVNTGLSSASGRPQMPAERGPRPQQQQQQQQVQKQPGAVRYFLLKSVSIENIERSVEEGIWATQKHNEEKLNKAYETSDAVHLIFSVNSSGYFQGWAKMTSRITLGQRDKGEWRGRLAVGGSFEVEWQRRYDLLMRSCDHLTNPWNEGKPVRIARDGQEMPSAVGKQLVDAIEKAAEQDHVIRPPKPQRRPPPEPPRRPTPTHNQRRQGQQGPMGMPPPGPGPMMGMGGPPFGMMPPRGPPMFGGAGDFGPPGGFPPPRANGPPMGMNGPLGGPLGGPGDFDRRPDFDHMPSPQRFPGGGPPQPPPRPNRGAHPAQPNGAPRMGGMGGRNADWQRGPNLLQDAMNGFDDDQPFDDQPAVRGRNAGNGPAGRGLLMGARDAMPSGLVGDGTDRMGGPQRRMPAPAMPDYLKQHRSKRDRSPSRSPSPHRRSRSRRRTRSRSDSRSASPAGGNNSLLNMSYEEYLKNFNKKRETDDRRTRETQQESSRSDSGLPTPAPMNNMMAGFMPGMLPGMMGNPAMNPLMMSMMMGGNGMNSMNPMMMGMNPMAGMGNNMGGWNPMTSMGMGGPMGTGNGMGSMPDSISEDQYLQLWQQYSVMNNQPFNANHYRQMYRQFKGL